MPTVECADKKAQGHALLLEFYGLREEPFGVTPNPDFLYYSRCHREALASLAYAIETKRGFSALVAEPGMGKTTLLFQLLEKVKSTARTAFLFRPDSNAHELMESLLGDLGINVLGQDIPQMHELLNSVLLEELNRGRHFVWVIDEAQDLDVEVLETIRLLSNFETTTSKLMHIVLAGQPALASKLAQPELLQLRQRVSTTLQLVPFLPRETAEYINHRLRVAGRQGPALFAPETVTMIARASEGIPRNINSLCFSCLSLGFVEQARQIGPEILHSVLADQESQRPPTRISDRIPPPAHAAAPQMWLEQNIEDSIGRGFPRRPPEHSRMWTGLGVFGFLLIPFTLLIFQSDSNSRLLDFLASPAAEAIIAQVTGYNTTLPGPPEMTAKSLQPPKPPADLAKLIKEAPPGQTVIEEPDALTEPPVASGIRLKQTHLQPAKPRKPIGPRVAYASREQTIFQLAMEYYGKSNWTIVREIRSHNPNIRDPYSTIKPGQRVVLPDLAPQYPSKP